ncbi:hypothetical protein E8E14_004949 [Neopestalotiopsis sp. 37M]|nr:hypothetical protein E8E14_004949 [Neopestalotiopsis sp. 37M]
MHTSTITSVALLAATISAAPNIKPQHELRDHYVLVQMFSDHSCSDFVLPDPGHPGNSHGDCTTRDQGTFSIKASGYNCRVTTWSQVNCDGSHANIPLDGKCHNVPYASYNIDCK